MCQIQKIVLMMVVLCIASITPNFADRAPQCYDNPILTGFHPDPSICRKGDDFYLINSSFEWFPGIPIHKSQDLVNWELIGYAMKDPQKCPMGRINTFAPTIRYHEGLFYIIVTCPGAGGNFYITAKDPAGEWSSPTMLPDAPGIDPSLFWDDDGRCYYIGHDNAKPREWVGHNHIWMRELDLKHGKLIGERKNLTSGHAANAMWTEGPHLYKVDGKYMLLVAEGGTSYYHAVTLFHSDTLWGPYTPDHANPIITHRHLGENYPTQAIGHADFVDTPNGEWWMVALGKRIRDGHIYLSRETFLLPMKLEKRGSTINEERSGYNTIIVNEGKGVVPDNHQRPNLPWSPVAKLAEQDNFDSEVLALRWNMRGVPSETWYSLDGGSLELKLRPESLLNLRETPSFLAQRITDYGFEATTEVNFTSKNSNEQVGLVIYRKNDCYAMLTLKGDQIVLESNNMGRHTVLFSTPNTQSGSQLLQLKSDGKDITFYYGPNKKKMTKIEATVPLSIISDLMENFYNGPMVGVYATSNGSPSKSTARFGWFNLRYGCVKR